MATHLVIDADGHCYEPDNDLAKWMPAEFAKRAPNRVTDSSGYSHSDDRRQALQPPALGRGTGSRRCFCAAHRAQPDPA